MRKWMRVLSSAVLSLILLTAAALPALAAPFQLNMPVKVELKGSRPKEPETFRIQLKALTPDAPMPEGSENGICILELKGPGTGSFPTLSFDHPMRVSYRITQLPGRTKHYTYDSTVYEMDVLAASTPQGLTPEVILTRAGQEEKAGELVFVNSYDPPAPPPGTDNPRLGDEFPLNLWMAAGILSLLGAVTLSVLTFRRKDD